MRILPLAALTLLAAGAIAGGTALANGGKHHGMGMIDTDGDRQVSAQEAADFQTKRFAELDTNGDGSITEAEWTELHQARFAKADSDGDGYITGDEMRSRMKQRHDGAEHKDGGTAN